MNELYVDFPFELGVTPADLNAKEFTRLLDTHDLKVSQAVKVHLASACRYQNLLRGLKKVRGSDDPNSFLGQKISQLEAEKANEIMAALYIAWAEQKQAWRFIEDCEEFLQLLKVKYQGNLDTLTQLESCQLKLARLYAEIYQAVVNEHYIGGKLPAF